jgi:hypothetical protein
LWTWSALVVENWLVTLGEPLVAARSTGAGAAALARLGRVWTAWLVLGSLPLTVEIGNRAVGISPFGLLLAPFVLLALRDTSRAASGLAARRLQATYRFGALTATIIYAGGWLAGDSGARVIAGSHGLVVLGLALFSRGMHAWSEQDRLGELLSWAWSRATLWSAAIGGTQVGLSLAWLAHRLVVGEPVADSVDVDLWVFLLLIPVALAPLWPIVWVARATTATRKQLALATP